MHAAWLLRRSHPPAEEALVVEARAFARALPQPVRLQVCVAVKGALAYVYAWTGPEVVNGAAACARSERLAPIAEWKGASAGGRAPFHYIVATDVEPNWEPEFNRWYQDEHMPGLAAVPGNVFCARLRSMDAAPRYHACYDLESPRVLDRREWLAVRHTDWAARVRPHFVNTRRIMFRTLLDER